LRRLNTKLKPDDPGWDMPWMAMDRSRLARSTLFITLVLLPLAASVYVLVRAESQLVPNGWRRFMTEPPSLGNAVQVVVILIAFCASVTFSILSWKYRPTLSEPVAPPQFFE
jgi:hypothetical protein